MSYAVFVNCDFAVLYCTCNRWHVCSPWEGVFPYSSSSQYCRFFLTWIDCLRKEDVVHCTECTVRQCDCDFGLLCSPGMFGESKQRSLLGHCGSSRSESRWGPGGGEWRLSGGGVHRLAPAEPRHWTGHTFFHQCHHFVTSSSGFSRHYVK